MVDEAGNGCRTGFAVRTDAAGVVRCGCDGKKVERRNTRVIRWLVVYVCSKSWENIGGWRGMGGWVL